MPTKTISLSFEVPADLDTPSEVLAKMKALLLQGLNEQFSRDTLFSIDLTPDERVLCKALLTES